MDIYIKEIETKIGRGNYDIYLVNKILNDAFENEVSNDNKENIKHEWFLLNFSPQFALKEKDFYKSDRGFSLNITDWENTDAKKHYLEKRYFETKDLLTKIRYGDLLITLFNRKDKLKEVVSLYEQLIKDLINGENYGVEDDIIYPIYLARYIVLSRYKFDQRTEQEKLTMISGFSKSIMQYLIQKEMFVYVYNISVIIGTCINAKNSNIFEEVKSLLSQELIIQKDEKLILILKCLIEFSLEDKEIKELNTKIGKIYEEQGDSEEQNIDFKRDKYRKAVRFFKEGGQDKKVIEKTTRKIELLARCYVRQYQETKETLPLFEIPKEFQELCQTDVEKGLLHTVNYLMTCITESIESLKKTLYEESPLLMSVKFQKISHKNLVVSEKNLYEVPYFIVKNCLKYFVQMFFNVIWDLKEQNVLKEENIFNIFEQSTFFIGRDNSLIEYAIERYFLRDYTSTVYILGTQIEDILRNGLFNLGGTSLNIVFENEDYNEDEKTLGTVINDLKDYFLESDNFRDDINLIEYVLNRKQGMNLRNDLAHGKATVYDLNWFSATLLLFLILLLSSYEYQE